MTAQTPMPPTHLVFHIGLTRRLAAPIVLLGIGLVVLVASASDADPGGRAAGWVVFAILAVAAALTFVLVWYPRLSLSDDGVALRQIGYTIRSSWENVERLILSPADAAILLKEPGVLGRTARVFRWVAAATPPAAFVGGPREAFAEGRAITLAPFIAHYHRGPLRAALERHLPHLLGTTDPGPV